MASRADGAFGTANVSISWDDLGAFHALHFQTDEYANEAASRGQHAEWSVSLANDGGGGGWTTIELGCYEDGVERTLTDEQIAIFRHSELQQLIKAHRLRQEESENEQDMTEGHELASSSVAGSGQDREKISRAKEHMIGATSPPSRQAPVTRQVPVTRHDANTGAGLEEQPASSESEAESRAQSKRRRRFYRPEKRDKEQFIGTSDERTFRRMCREADDTKDSTIELDY